MIRDHHRTGGLRKPPWQSASRKGSAFSVELDFENRVEKVKLTFADNIVDDYTFSVQYVEADKDLYYQKQEAERIAKRNKKIAIITTPIICAIIAFIIVLNTVIIPNGKYNDAIALMDAGNIVEAYEALIALDGYKDSADKANSIYDKYKVEKLKVANVGDYVFFWRIRAR